MRKAMRKARGSEKNSIPLVSVIIPVFNGERYLGEMLESVVRQTVRRIEIICVDDGSSDRSREIICGFRKRDARIRLISQLHQNAGTARNRGLGEARGKYVVFWDADDRFHRRALESMCAKMEKTGAELCVCGVCETFASGRVFDADYLKTELVPERDPFNKFDVDGGIFDFASNMIWNKMFRRSFLMRKRLRFQDIAQSNDTAFVMLALYHAESITCVDRRLVYYRVDNPESLTGGSSRTPFCPYEAYLSVLGELKRQKHFELVRESFRNKAVLGMFRALNFQTSYDAYVKLYDFLKNEGLAALEIDQCRREELREEWMYRDLELMKNATAGEFLISKTNERRLDRDQLKYTLRRVRKRLAFLLLVNEKLKQVRGIVCRGRKGE